jgi:amino acid transporter
VGAPLFILVPLNIIEYQVVSVGSLLLAAILSTLMAKVYAAMYTDSAARGLNAVGGPSFTRVACGTRSARYFISRLSMWLSNTALAAYTKIVFLLFDLEVMPGILRDYGLSEFAVQVIVYLMAAVFVGWSAFNALFERRFLRVIGYVQIVFTAMMMIILVYHSLLLGSVGAWDLSGMLHLSADGNWVSALIINTGYLYILFFGFQEIQALERDAIQSSSIPIVSWIRRGYRMARSRYLGVAMITSVVAAASINILYAMSVYAAHPSLTDLQTSQIPAIYLATRFLGPGHGVLIAVAFLIATITTFVPAFLAASRHLTALGEDGFMPKSLSNLSWAFTLVAIFILAVANQNFLVAVTDFLVLISLGIITLSAIWLRKSGILSERRNILPLLVGISCFGAGAAVYFVNEAVVIFGFFAIALTYLFFDILELGALGSQLFLGILDAICLVVLSLIPFQVLESGYLVSLLGLTPPQATQLLPYLLLGSAGLISANILVDVGLLRRSAVTRSL